MKKQLPENVRTLIKKLQLLTPLQRDIIFAGMPHDPELDKKRDMFIRELREREAWAKRIALTPPKSKGIEGIDYPIED